MTSERLREIEKLFHAARERPPAERDAFLARACADDPTLRREVESLLAQPPAGAIDAPVGALVAELVTPPSPRLAPGSSVGPYQIEHLLGVGGMGEVYRARDTTLGRDVAIKILPRHFTADPERLARFEREARMLAALNHPHIAAIHGVVDAEGVQGAGPRAGGRRDAGRSDPARTGASNRGAHDCASNRRCARRSARERDHSPGSQTGEYQSHPWRRGEGAGLRPREGGGRRVAIVDVTVGGTQEGTILGTAAYMSPEQARGQAVDKRTDIWAFGCVLYEMLTGHVAFPGETLSDTIVAILEREPDWAALPATTPPMVARLLHRGLEKHHEAASAGYRRCAR